MSYEAFGKRRGGDWRAATDTSYSLPSFTNRGHTGHEHVDEMGLIHMTKPPGAALNSRRLALQGRGQG